jgi:predicted RNA-binding Zn-ribbon protein involved in translation (DUF1610 family)
MKSQKDKKPKDRSEDEDFEDEESVQPDEGRDVYAEVRKYASNPGQKYAEFSRHNLQEAAARYGDSDPVTLHIYDIGCFCKKMGIALSVTELENLANMRSGRTQAARDSGAEAAQGLSKKDIKDAFGEVLEPVVERLDKLEEHVYEDKVTGKGKSKQKAKENQRKMQELEEPEAEEQEEETEEGEEDDGAKDAYESMLNKLENVTAGPTMGSGLSDEYKAHIKAAKKAAKAGDYEDAKEMLELADKQLDYDIEHCETEEVDEEEPEAPKPKGKAKKPEYKGKKQEEQVTLTTKDEDEPEEAEEDTSEPKKENGRKHAKKGKDAEKAKYESMFKEVSDMGVEIAGEDIELSEGYQVGMNHAEKLAKSGNYKEAMDTLAFVKQDVENSKAEAAEEEGEEEPEEPAAEEEPEQPEDNADYKDYEFETVEEAAAFRKGVGRDNCKVLKDGVTIRVGKDGIRKYHFTGKLMKDLKAEAEDDEDPDPLAKYVVENAELIKGHRYSFAKNQLFEVEVPVKVAEELGISEVIAKRKGKQHEDDTDSEVVEDGEDAEEPPEEDELAGEEAEEPPAPGPGPLIMPPPRPPRGAPKPGPTSKAPYLFPPPKPGPPPAKAEEEHDENAESSTPGPEALVEFECPLCGANVNYHDEKCGECGAEFEHTEDEEPPAEEQHPERGTYEINEKPPYGGGEVVEVKLNYPDAKADDLRDVADGLSQRGADLVTTPISLDGMEAIVPKEKAKTVLDYLNEQGFHAKEEPVEEVVDEVPEEVTPDEIGAGDIDEEFANVEETAPKDETVPPPGPPERAPQVQQTATKEPDVADVDKDLDKLLEGLDEPSDDDLERKRKVMDIEAERDRVELEMAMKAKDQLHVEKMEDGQQEMEKKKLDHKHRMEEHKAGMPVTPPAQEQPEERSLDHIMKNLKKGNGSKGTVVKDSVVQRSDIGGKGPTEVKESVVIKSDLPGPINVDGQSIVKGKPVGEEPEEKQEKTGADVAREARKKAKQKAKKGN